MNATTIEGQDQSLTGSVKEAAGKVTGNDSLQARGAADQATGDLKQVIGAAKDAIGNPAPLIEKARAFAKNRPWATAALAGTIGIAVLNSLRGK